MKDFSVKTQGNYSLIGMPDVKKFREFSSKLSMEEDGIEVFHEDGAWWAKTLTDLDKILDLYTSFISTKSKVESECPVPSVENSSPEPTNNPATEGVTQTEFFDIKDKYPNVFNALTAFLQKRNGKGEARRIRKKSEKPRRKELSKFLEKITKDTGLDFYFDALGLETTKVLHDVAGKPHTSKLGELITYSPTKVGFIYYYQNRTIEEIKTLENKYPKIKITKGCQCKIFLQTP